MIKWLGSKYTLIASLLMILPLASCTTGAGRYSVDSRAMSSSWMLVGILFGGYALYSIIKHIFASKDDSKKDDDHKS
jgi:hypothetical protein